MKTLLLLMATLGAAFSSPELDEFISGNQLFSASLYQEAIKSVERENFLICPFSAETVLALTAAAAKGETAKEFQQGLKLPATKEATEAAFKELLPTFKGNDYFNLSTANKIFVQQGFVIDEGYRSVATEVYNAGIDNVDFTKSVETARVINNFVENQTNDKIHDLISPADLNSDSRVVLVNALYFMGEWVNHFKKHSTYNETFHISANESVQVDMMHNTDFFNYNESAELNAKFLKSPFVGTDITFTVVLPNEIDGLPTLEAKLADVLKAPKYSWEKVNVSLPKFKIESTIELNDVLKNLGIKKAFDFDADLSGFGADGLVISKVIQKTFIDLNENGVEAAAATAVRLQLGSAIAEPHWIVTKEFLADKPFLFYIAKENVCLFTGRVYKP